MGIRFPSSFRPLGTSEGWKMKDPENEVDKIKREHSRSFFKSSIGELLHILVLLNTWSQASLLEKCFIFKYPWRDKIQSRLFCFKV